MMEYNQEYFEALLFEKVAGTISKDDDLVAEKAIADFPEVGAFYLQLQSKMSRPTAESFLSKLDENKSWLQVAPTMEENQPLPLLVRYKAYFTIAAMLLIGIPLFWHFLPESSNKAFEKPAVHEQVYLKTSDGKTIGLATDQTLRINGVTVQSKANTLSYAPEGAATTEQATLYVPATKDYKLHLPDGTQVWMNSASSLRFPFNFDNKTREVYLTGEAYFEVATDKKREFIVHTDYADVRVHGTSFNVNAYAVETFAASLVEGSVSAAKNTQLIQLKPNQQATLTANRLNIQSFDKQEVLSWRKGTYYFHNRPLAEISQVLNRWYDIHIVYSSSGLAEQTFTGEIDKALPLNVLISNLELTSGIKGDLRNGTLTFR